MFIVMKNAEVHVWKFVRPAFEWIFVSQLDLSSSKNIQIMSLNFDCKSRTLYWCERRTPTQCCVCRRTVSIDSEKEMLSKTSDILHNCPPVQLYIVGPSGVLLQPMANSPTGLTMYWSAASSQLQVTRQFSKRYGAILQLHSCFMVTMKTRPHFCKEKNKNRA